MLGQTVTYHVCLTRLSPSYGEQNDNTYIVLGITAGTPIKKSLRQPEVSTYQWRLTFTDLIIPIQ